MADIRSFPGLRYDPDRAGHLADLVAPPYDVLDDDEVADLRDRSPYNVVHLTRPGDEYEAAGRVLQSWIEDRVLVPDAPAMYLHEVQYDKRVRRDLIAALRLQPYSDGVVLPHERTHAGPKEDRLKLFQATAASLEPLWFLYDGASGAARHVLEEGFGRPPQAEFEFDGDRHRLWVLEEVGWQLEVSHAFADLELLIADGHHRYETALAYAEEVGGPPNASSRFTLALLTDIHDPGLEVLPTHRVLKTGVAVTGGQEAADLQATLAAVEGKEAAGTYRDGHYQILPLEGDMPVVELHRQVIENVIGRKSLEESVDYTRDPAEAVRWVDEGRAVEAFFLGRPELGAVLKRAREGKTMPQKSTYFFPKPPSGMVVLRLDANRNL